MHPPGVQLREGEGGWTKTGRKRAGLQLSWRIRNWWVEGQRGLKFFAGWPKRKVLAVRRKKADEGAATRASAARLPSKLRAGRRRVLQKQSARGDCTSGQAKAWRRT